MTSKPFDPKTLEITHSRQIDEMIAGIRGGADAILWTRDLRAAVRGGKCRMVGVSADESTSSD